MSFQKPLIDWFQKHQRPLPWRRHYRPYEVWVSEIMLQQTQVNTALPYYDKWMRAFPDITSLAEAEESHVLKLWEGLGYYSRARNIHASAKEIMNRFNGDFPSRYEDILSLKGVGRYSAGAVASIAFNQPRPIVDGNVFRVLSRIFALKDNIDIPKNREKFWKLEESLIPKGQARFFNQALMELGALICSSDNPKCAVCPVQKFCKAFKQNKQEFYPVRSKRKKTIKVQASAVVFSLNKRYWIHRRPVGEIMGGLWEFPEHKVSKNRKYSPDQIRQKTSRWLSENFGLNRQILKLLRIIRRSYTHHQEDLYVWDMPLDQSDRLRSRLGWPSNWITKSEFKSYPLSSAHAKIEKHLAN